MNKFHFFLFFLSKSVNNLHGVYMRFTSHLQNKQWDKVYYAFSIVLQKIIIKQRVIQGVVHSLYLALSGKNQVV